MCGVIGISNCPEASMLAYLGLYALQHRGQESTGIVVSDMGMKGIGRVSEFFTKERLNKLNRNNDRFAIGHNRYSTAGNKPECNVQPLSGECSKGKISVSHNGNLINAHVLRYELKQEGVEFCGDSDTEVILKLILKYAEESSIIDSISKTVRRINGAYSLVILTEEGIVAVRDPHGFRPLCYGSLGRGYVISSETCALDLIGAKYKGEIHPGSIVHFSKITPTRTTFFFQKTQEKKCIFELIYFSRPDSNVYGRNVHLIRKAHGKQLARETYINADIVIPVPDSGVPAAIGFSEEAGIPFDMGFIRNHYIGRTFIEPEQHIRNFSVKIKLNPVKEMIEGKRVVVVDDSLVRGTTAKKIIELLRNAGAAEIHMRISSPPTKHPCYYGIDTPTESELLASRLDISKMCMYIGAESLAFLSHEGLMKVTGSDSFCDFCFTGKCPL